MMERARKRLSRVGSPNPAPVIALCAVLVGACLAGTVSARPAPTSFADLAERLLPSVVNISTSQAVPEQQDDGSVVPGLPPGSPMEEFFRQFLERGRPDTRPRPTASLGSGFVIDPSGYIVTNEHVIAEADSITVTLHNNVRLKAEVVGRDTKTDIAVLKVEPKRPLPAAVFGDSDKVRVGDWIITIGNPFGLGGTVTAGIVSARQRDINAGPYDAFIQTDAAINRGNSGGPMFNMQGEIVGINSAIYAPTGTNVGIGFAIPSNLADPIVNQIQEYGKARRGWLGVQIQAVTEDIARGLDMSEAAGALVTAVTADSAAEKAGINIGDVILEFDGKDVERMRSLPRIVAETRVGKEVSIVVWRQGERVTVTATLGEFPEDDQLALAGAAPDNSTVLVRDLGMTIASVTPELREQYSLKSHVKGVVIVGITDGGAAARKDLAEGMIIRRIGSSQRNVETPSTVVQEVARARGSGQKNVLMLIESSGNSRFVVLDIGKD